MTWFNSLIVMAIIVGAVYLSGLTYKHEIQTSITIISDKTTVWKHLTDFEQYPKWNPFIVSIEGTTVFGEKLRVMIHPPNSEPMEFQPKWLVIEEEKELRWLGQVFVPGLFDGEHYFKIQPNEDESVEFIHGEIFSGILAWLMMSKIKDHTRQGFLAMNEQLKLISESK